MEFMGKNDCAVIVDPSAASFIAELRSRGVYVQEADNNVLDGIRTHGQSCCIAEDCLINERCSGLIDEIGDLSVGRQGGAARRRKAGQTE